jgi:Ca-activated chloride channel homolog
MSRRHLSSGFLRLALLLAPGCLFAQPGVVTFDEGLSRFRAEEPVVRERTELVTLTVTVTDGRSRPVTGLRAEHFEVYEDKVRQQVEFFAEADTPVSVAVIFDLSGSMARKAAQARAALRAFVEHSHPEDDFYLIAFSEQPVARAEAVGGDELVRLTAATASRGATALYDAVYQGLETLARARHPKRALLVISDGADNHSRRSFGDLRRRIKESDVQIYGVGVDDGGGAECGRLCRMSAQVNLDEMARVTGGRAFFPVNPGGLEDAASAIAVELRRQYSVGYVPSGTKRDGRWREIKLRVRTDGLARAGGEQPQGRVVARTREGYYARP